MIVAQQQNEYDELQTLEQTIDVEQRQKTSNNSVKIKNKVLISLFFALIGTYILCQQVNIAKVQNSLYDSQQNLREYQAENQALNVDIVKSTNLETIEQKAQANYGMQVAGPEDYIKVKLKPSLENGQAREKVGSNRGIAYKVLRFFNIR